MIKKILKSINDGGDYVYVAANLVKAVVPMVILPFCLNLIGGGEFGVLSGEYAAALLVAFVIDYSVAVYGTAELARTSNSGRIFKIINLFAIKFVIFIFVIVIVYIAFLLFGLSKSLILLILFSGLTAVFEIGWVYLWNKKYHKYFVSIFFGFGLGVLIPLCIWKMGVIDAKGAVIGLIVAPAFFANFLAFYLLIGSNHGLMHKLVSRISFKTLLIEIKSKAPIFSSQIISAFYTTTGPILLNFYGKHDYAGLWLIVNRLAIGVGNFAVLSVKSSTKELLSDWAKINRPLTEKFLSYFIVYLFFSSLLIVPLIFAPLYVSYYLFGNEYQLTIIDCILIITWTLMPFFSYIATTFLIYKEKYRNLLFLTGSNLIVYFVLSHPLTMAFGLTGFILTMVISQFYLLFILCGSGFARNNE